jgi:hypothetical protein
MCEKHTVPSLLKTRSVKPAETAIAREQLCKHALVRQWLSSHYVMAPTDTHTIIEDLLEAMFSVRSVARLFAEAQLSLPVNLDRVERESAGRLKVAVAEVRDSSGTQKKPLPSRAVKTVTENTSLCVIVICKVQSRVVC